jgi:hypothetical protein
MSAAAEIPVDPATVPGGIEHYLRRELPDGGLIEFEQAPAGWLTKAGEVRRKPWRAYMYTPPGGKRTRLPSTTTLLDAICPKDGLPHWSEARGIEGAVEAMRHGLIGPNTSPADAVGVVRSNRLGAEAIRDRAADRGLNVHDCLEQYMTTGRAPRLAEHHPDHHGYISALTKWLLHAKPEPLAVEQLVCHPEDGYAGRLDLRARIGGLLTTVDLKTQERAGIYRTAHWQVCLYERAAVRCGDEPASRKIVVVVAADGEFREMAADHDDSAIDTVLAYYRACKPVDSVCESANRVERNSRKAAA